MDYRITTLTSFALLSSFASPFLAWFWALGLNLDSLHGSLVLSLSLACLSFLGHLIFNREGKDEQPDVGQLTACIWAWYSRTLCNNWTSMQTNRAKAIIYRWSLVLCSGIEINGTTRTALISLPHHPLTANATACQVVSQLTLAIFRVPCPSACLNIAAVALIWPS